MPASLVALQLAPVSPCRDALRRMRKDVDFRCLVVVLCLLFSFVMYMDGWIVNGSRWVGCCGVVGDVSVHAFVIVGPGSGSGGMSDSGGDRQL